ncbi:MAG: caspase family protein, partial [Planctomycetales bacterium]|nr:caspase family protein [Planctomycetales bacterium]
MFDRDGRFDGSDGGEVPGFHWVVGDETISLHQLRQRYFEPRLLAKVLGYHEEPRRDVARFAVPKLFPRYDVKQRDPNQPKFVVELANRGGGIGRVVVTLNGKELSADARGNQVASDAQRAELSIDLSGDPRLVPDRDNVLDVVVYNQEGYLASRDRRISFRVAPPSKMADPELWAIVVGAADYRGSALDLRYAAKDAEDFAAALKLGAEALFGAEHVHVTVLSSEQTQPNGKPSRENIRAALQAAQSARSTDVFVLYLAGHGVNQGGADSDFYFLTDDAENADLTDPALRTMTALSSAELAEAIGRTPALRQVMILDTCASGRLVEKLTAIRSVPSSQLRALERVKERTGIHVLAGCAADAVSYEASRFGQGLLTHTLLLGMRGAALRDEEFVDVATLFGFAADRVPQLARDIGGIQRPLIASPKGGGSFDVARIAFQDRDKIPLHSPLPLVLRANFQDEAEFADTLSLSRMLNDHLREVSSRGHNVPLVFVDAAQLPSAYRIVGRYDVTNDNVRVRVHLFRDQERVGQFVVSESRQALDRLIANIATQI